MPHTIRNQPIQRIVADLVALAKAWWYVDRPRASPREGRLLRVEPPAIVEIDSRRIEVISRTVERQIDPPCVTYRCRCGGEDCELRVSPITGTFRLEVHRIDRHGDTFVAEDEVQVFAPRTFPRNA